MVARHGGVGDDGQGNHGAGDPEQDGEEGHAEGLGRIRERYFFLPRPMSFVPRFASSSLPPPSRITELLTSLFGCLFSVLGIWFALYFIYCFYCSSCWTMDCRDYPCVLISRAYNAVAMTVCAPLA